MARRDDNLQARLDRDLAELKLLEIAKSYREVLDEAARKGSSLLEVLAILIGMEQAAREQRALERRLREARLPKQKTLAEYDFKFPKRIPKAAILRLFDCDFIEQHGCAVLIGPTGTGKSHLLTALGYTAAERGYSVRHTRVVDMINHLTAAQINGSLGKTLRSYVRPSLLLLDELGYLPIDKRGADLLFQVVAARYEVGSIVITTNRTFREWGTLFDVDNTLATALIDRLMHHGEAIVIQGDSFRMKDKASRFDRRVTKAQYVNVRIGCSMRSEVVFGVSGRERPAHPRASPAVVPGHSSGRFLEERARVDPRL